MTGHSLLNGAIRDVGTALTLGVVVAGALYLTPHDSPYISDRPQYLREQRLFLQHGTEAFHQCA